MSRNRSITDKLAIEILNEKIRKCEKALESLEIGTEDYNDVMMEFRMYQRHKDVLMEKDGVESDG